MATYTTFPSDAADKFVVRFPDGMRDQIADAARSAGRSMNAEIVHRLEQSFSQPGATSLDQEVLRLLEARIAKAHEASLVRMVDVMRGEIRAARAPDRLTDAAIIKRRSAAPKAVETKGPTKKIRGSK